MPQPPVPSGTQPPSPRARRSPRVTVPGKVDANGRPVTRLPDGTLLLQRYALTFLAAGGMGAVYKARDLQTGHEVVVKEAFSRTPDDHAMVIVALTQEREALIRLDHPYIVKALDFFIENGSVYLVLEYVAGRTLESLIDGGHPLTEWEAVDFALQVCEALDHIHGAGLVYRDLKPENVMATDHPDGGRTVKLIDFGTIRLFKLGQRRDTSALGTVGFAPPEQFGTGQTDPRSDLYSLGATLHYLLSLVHPDESPFQFEPLRKLNPNVSDILEGVVARAVRQNPADRFASAAEMRTALLGTRKGCPTCGAANRARSKFCIACGQPLASASTPAPTAAAPPAVRPPATASVGPPASPVHSPTGPTPSLPGSTVMRRGMSGALGPPAPAAASSPSPTVSGSAAGRPAHAPGSPGGLPPTVTLPAAGGTPSLPAAASRATRIVTGPTAPPRTASAPLPAASAPLPAGSTAPTPYAAPQPPAPALAGGVAPPPLTGPQPALLPTPGPASRGRVLHVDAGGKAPYRRIQDAIESARPGDVIEVAAGLYPESLKISDRIVVKGAGPKLTRVRSSGERPAVEISGSDGTWIEGLGLEYQGTRPNCVVWVLNSRVILQNNAIQGGTLSGVEYGSRATGEIRSNEIHGNRQTGIFIHSGSTAAIVGNYIHQNGVDTNTGGIEVRERSNLPIEGNLIVGNGIGIYVHDHSSPVIRGNTIHRNGRGTDFMAVEIKEGSDPVLEGNVISENSGGILVKGRSKPRIVGNHIIQNGASSGGSGLEILEASAPQVEGNLIEGNGSGIAVRDGSAPKIRRNQIVGNGVGGNISALEVGGASNVMVDHNLIARNAAGILIHNGSRAQVTDNVVVENGLKAELNGIEVRGQSDVVVFHNLVLHNGGAGVWYHQSSTGEIENNIVSANVRGVVGTEARGSPLMLGYNDVWGNQTDYVGLKKATSDICADPLFVDVARWDFRLSASSPCTRAGRGGIPQGPRGG